MSLTAGVIASLLLVAKPTYGYPMDVWDGMEEKPSGFQHKGTPAWLELVGHCFGLLNNRRTQNQGPSSQVRRRESSSSPHRFMMKKAKLMASLSLSLSCAHLLSEVAAQLEHAFI